MSSVLILEMVGDAFELIWNSVCLTIDALDVVEWAVTSEKQTNNVMHLQS